MNISGLKTYYFYVLCLFSWRKANELSHIFHGFYYSLYPLDEYDEKWIVMNLDLKGIFSHLSWVNKCLRTVCISETGFLYDILIIFS